MISITYFKIMANDILKDLQIIIYKEPKFIKDINEIQIILHNHHNIPTGGHVGQHRLYRRVRQNYK